MPPGATIQYSLVVRGRLAAGQSLAVSENESYDVANAPTPIPGRAQLCYQHGTSRRLCSDDKSALWKVRLASGSDQFLTLRVDGKTVARVVYRDVHIAGPPVRGVAPVDIAQATAPAVSTPQEPTPTTATGGLSGPLIAHEPGLPTCPWTVSETILASRGSS